MSRRKVIDLPLLELFASSGVRPLVTGLRSTDSRVSALESKIPTKVSATLHAEDWYNDEYSFNDLYPSATSGVEILSNTDSTFVEDVYAVHCSSFEVGRMYQLYDTESPLEIWVECLSMEEVDNEMIYTFDSYDDREKTTFWGTITAKIISTEEGYDLDVYLDEDNATRAQRDAFVDAVMSSNINENIIAALDGAPSIDIPIILEVVRKDGAENS